jgi:glycosyltransferase involved in cell wall biosynthesis
MVIIDDRSDPSFKEPVTGRADVRYFCLPQKLTIGAKRNLAVSRASGEVIVHWDSDDIYAPERIERQVEQLVTSSQCDLVGYNEMEFLDEPRQERYAFRQGQPIGVSFCYWRDTWEQRRFSEAQIGEDAEFTNGRQWRAFPSLGLIVARIHPGNTSDKRSLIPENPNQWRRIA